MSRLLISLILSLSSFAVVAADPLVVDVELDSYTIKPDVIHVKVGQPVTLKITNKATFIPHNLVIKAPESGVEFKVDVRAGKTGEISFSPTKAGTYEMICDKEPPIGKSHKEKGMHGKLIVE